MADHLPEPAHGDDHGDVFKLYVIVFAALAVATGISFGAYELLGHGMSSLVIIMIVSVIKASLVAYVFMHLKFDWRKVFGIMLPVVVMAVMLIIVLLPDLVFAWHRKPEPESQIVPGNTR